VPLAGDMRLFVLDDEGVLFSESRQELYSTNTAATFLWCLLEDGTSLGGVVEAYARTFNLPQAEAEQHVYPTLRRWVALGHVSDPGLPATNDTELTESLAFLLTNAELRNRFRTSPAAAASALGLRTDALAAFLAIAPDALDRQADEIDRYRRQLRFQVPDDTLFLDNTDLLSRGATAIGESPQRRRCFRLVRTIFAVTMSAALDSIVLPALEHLEVEPTVEPDVQLHVRESDSGCIIFDGAMPVSSCECLDTLVPSLKLQLRKLAVARHRYFMEIHAGVIVLGDCAVLLPGSAGSGKTTLTAALAHSGGTYFSDEIALLEQTSLDVRPVPLTLTIKPGSVAPLRDRYPELPTLREHLREDRQPVRYLPPPLRSRCAPDAEPRPVAWVVFPHYEEGGDTVMTPVKRPAGLRRLLDKALVLPHLLTPHTVERLVGWVRRVDFYDLRIGALDAAVAAMRALAPAAKK
jgi:hypothetical protein